MHTHKLLILAIPRRYSLIRPSSRRTHCLAYTAHTHSPDTIGPNDFMVLLSRFSTGNRQMSKIFSGVRYRTIVCARWACVRVA